MAYNIVGNITYSTAGNRTTALNAINAVLANYTTTGVTTTIAAGVNTAGTTGITISIQCSDTDVNALRAALIPAWTGVARTAAFVGVFKV